MRCFLAVLPPREIIDDVAAFVAPRHGVEGWRWARPENYHLTLAFMDDYPEGRAEELAEAIDDWARRRAPFEARLAGAGCFGSPERSKLIYLAVPGQAARRLTEWSEQLRALAARHGGRPDGAGFTPHLTVARTNRGRPAGRLVQALDTYESPPFSVEQVALVRSRLAERRYEVLHRASVF